MFKIYTKPSDLSLIVLWSKQVSIKTLFWSESVWLPIVECFFSPHVLIICSSGQTSYLNPHWVSSDLIGVTRTVLTGYKDTFLPPFFMWRSMWKLVGFIKKAKLGSSTFGYILSVLFNKAFLKLYCKLFEVLTYICYQ